MRPAESLPYTLQDRARVFNVLDVKNVTNKVRRRITVLVPCNVRDVIGQSGDRSARRDLHIRVFKNDLKIGVSVCAIFR
jgi:hypothetical protein